METFKELRLESKQHYKNETSSFWVQDLVVLVGSEFLGSWRQSVKEL
jgi:hypothetical protein